MVLSLLYLSMASFGSGTRTSLTLMGGSPRSAWTEMAMSLILAKTVSMAPWFGFQPTAWPLTTMVECI